MLLTSPSVGPMVSWSLGNSQSGSSGSSYSLRLVSVVFSLPSRSRDEDGCRSIRTVGAVIGLKIFAKNI